MPPPLLLVVAFGGCGGGGAPGFQAGGGDGGGQDTGRDWSEVDPYEPPAFRLEPPDAAPGERARVVYEGALAGRDRLVLRYGFDGWTMPLEGASEENHWGATVRAVEVEMEGDGGSRSVEIDLPPDAAALHAVLVDPDSGDTDDRDGLEYHWGLVFPYAGPYLLLEGEDDAASGRVVVAWEGSAPCLGIVEYATDGTLDDWTTGDERSVSHRVGLEGLPLGEPVTYRVRDCTGRATEARTFRLPAAGAASVRIAAMSDMQDSAQGQRWADTAAAALARDPDLVLLAGDMAAFDEPGWWWRFFDGGRELLATRPAVAVPGNHDTPGVLSDPDTTSFEYWWGEPARVVAFGPARLLLLNSEDEEAWAEGGEQRALAEAEVARAHEGPRIAAWHVPPYDAGDRHAAETSRTRPLTAVLDGAVDWVIAGHEHLYQRFLPVAFEAEARAAYGRGKGAAPGYVVLPPAGQAPNDDLVSETSPWADQRDLLAYPEPAAGSTAVSSEIGFVELELGVGGDALTAWGIGTRDQALDPHAVDSATMER